VVRRHTGPAPHSTVKGPTLAAAALSPPPMGADVRKLVRNRVREIRGFPAMAMLELFLTNDCNLRCTYCFVGHKRPEQMSLETALAAFDALLDRSAHIEELGVLLFGGEPFLCMDLIQGLVPEARYRARKQGKRIDFHCTTNGTVLDEATVQYCQRNNIVYLLSIDGYGAHHDYHRRYADGRGSFDDIRERLPVMLRYQPWQGSRYTVAPELVEYVEQDVRELHKLGVNQFIIGPASGNVPWTAAGIRLFFDQMVLLRRYREEMKQKGRPFRMTLFEGPEIADGSEELPPPKYKGIWGCGAGRGRLCAAVNGDLYGCSKLMTVRGTAEEGLMRLGNAHDGQVDLAVRAEMCDVQAAQRTRCTGCNYADYCCGGCPATNWQGTGSAYIPSDIDCAFAQAFIELGWGRSTCPDISFAEA